MTRADKAQQQARYHLANRERRNAYTRAWRAANRARAREGHRAWCAANADRRMAVAHAYDLRRRATEKQTAIAYYGGRCARCGFTDIRALCVDHINGDGRAHRERLNGKPIHRWLIQQNFPPGFQVLCANCNLIKAIEQGELGRNTPRGPRQRKEAAG